MEDAAILKKNLNIVTRTIEDETILMPIYKSSDEINCIYTLNYAAARVWGMIDGKRKLGEIKKLISKEFDTTEKELNKELAKVIKDLAKIRAVR